MGWTGSGWLRRSRSVLGLGLVVGLVSGVLVVSGVSAQEGRAVSGVLVSSPGGCPCLVVKSF